MLSKMFKGLKVVSKAPDHARTLKYELHKRIPHTQPSRAGGVIHASDLTAEEEFCPRYFALMQMHGQEPFGRFINTSMAVTFKMGHVLQDFISETLADLIVGDWRCLLCDKVVATECAKPEACPECGVNFMRHEEVRFTSKLSGASAGIDSIFDLGGPKLRFAEIKTIDKDEFKKLVAPKAEHKWRTSLYLRIIAESGRPLAKKIDTQKALVLYVSKGGFGVKDLQPRDEWHLKDGTFSPFKEFEVKRDDALTEKITEKARVLTMFRESGVIPAGVCITPNAERAKFCKMCKQCFSGDFPKGAIWNQ